MEEGRRLSSGHDAGAGRRPRGAASVVSAERRGRGLHV